MNGTKQNTRNTIEQDIERPLGAAEEIFWRLDDSSPMNCIAVCDIKGGISEEDIKAALVSVQKRHPNLRVKVSDRGKEKPWYVSGVDEIPLVVFEDEVDSLAYVQKELLVPFDSEKGPMVRCALLRQKDGIHKLYLNIHHSISDGASSVFLLRDIVQAAGMYRETGACDLEELQPIEYFRDRLPGNVKGLLGFFRYLYTIFRLVFGIVPLGAPKFLKVKDAVPVEDRELVILTKKFEPSLMSALYSRAKKEGTTVHGALFSAIVLASAKDINEGEPVCVGCASSVDMRTKLVPPVGEDVGYFVSVVGSGHKVSSNDALWPLARDIRDEAKAALSRKMDMILMPFPYRLHAWMGRRIGRRNSAKYAKYLEGAHNPPCIVLTNVGNIGIETQHGPFSIVDMEFYANPSVLTPFGSLVSTLKGEMRWTLVGSSPVISRQQLEQVFSDAQNYLADSIGWTDPEAKKNLDVTKKESGKTEPELA